MRLTINSLAVYEYGNIKKQAIVFVHGFPFDHTMWEEQVKVLQDKYYIVVYDIRGLGESYVGDGQFTMEAFVNDLMSIINDFDLHKPVLCGLSMGGYIALRTIEKEQNKFGGLILCDTRAESDDDDGKLKRADVINTINVDGLAKFIDGFVPNLFAEETQKEKKELYDNVMRKCKSHNPLGVKGSLIAMLSRTSTVDFLPKIKIPTLVLVGAQDKLTPPPMMRKMAESIKKSEFGIAPRAGHLAPLENPSFVNDMIDGFIGRKVLKKN
ncbi:MAG: alpha/beta hydrolase [Melioribacteraceae bacterium]|nr:alpha/beta hydrolase [Melioribacteraceae bacterium]MCF8355282.1 alpha/beta hydrolase [Melioribacteraceae bacterium]MCF8394128.1 alpha/beta hydrolase [Melioribacteraceae bacterium]MCF8418133.1 alpha/beta hydrolase [Melioribacteraceae bacterium]